MCRGNLIQNDDVRGLAILGRRVEGIVRIQENHVLVLLLLSFRLQDVESVSVGVMLDDVEELLIVQSQCV